MPRRMRVPQCAPVWLSPRPCRCGFLVGARGCSALAGHRPGARRDEPGRQAGRSIRGTRRPSLPATSPSQTSWSGRPQGRGSSVAPFRGPAPPVGRTRVVAEPMRRCGWPHGGSATRARRLPVRGRRHCAHVSYATASPLEVQKALSTCSRPLIAPLRAKHTSRCDLSTRCIASNWIAPTCSSIWSGDVVPAVLCPLDSWAAAAIRLDSCRDNLSMFFPAAIWSQPIRSLRPVTRGNCIIGDACLTRRTDSVQET